MKDHTLLFRQVSPSWVQQGRVTSQVFTPTPKDEKRLSVYDGELVSAEKSWAHYTYSLKFSSVGVMAVAVEECQRYALPAVSDPSPFPEHAVIDFRQFGTNEIRTKAKQLRAAADSRGWQYRAEDAS